MSRKLGFLICGVGIAFTFPASSQDWYIERESDLILDTSNIFAFLETYQEQYANLVLRCYEQQLDAMIVWGEPDTFQDADYYVEVITRFDSDPPEQTTMELSTDLSTTFVRQPKIFMEEIRGRERLAVRTGTILGTATLLFDLTMAAPVVEEVLGACE